MKLITMPIGYSQENTYIYYDESTREGVIIDPGGDGNLILEVIEENKLTIKNILLTHGHFDHIESVHFMKEKTGAEVVSHKLEVVVTNDSNINLSSQVKGVPIEIIPDKLLNEGDEINLSNIKIKLIHTPGHTPGGCCYYVEEEKLLFSGDTLFFQSIGRTDFELGNEVELLHSIKYKLFLLPNDVQVLSGHGKSTTIGNEKENNTFIMEGN
jgi:hydroxyacylglutathione hydrolase